MTRDAVAYLLAKGHRRVGMIIGPRSLVVSQERIRGWEEAHQAAKRKADPKLIAEGDYMTDSGRAAMRQFLSLPEPPDAVFATGFLMMAGCLAELKPLGIRVPEQIELMTWSDSPMLDIFDPPISTVQQPSYEMGLRAADLILKRIAHPDAPPETIVVPAELRIRDARPVG